MCICVFCFRTRKRMRGKTNTSRENKNYNQINSMVLGGVGGGQGCEIREMTTVHRYYSIPSPVLRMYRINISRSSERARDGFRIKS